MVRAYILIETAPGKEGEVMSSVPHGLMNCLALVHGFMPGEVLVHLHCEKLDYLNTAIMDIAKKNGVKNIITLLVKIE